MLCDVQTEDDTEGIIQYECEGKDRHQYFLDVLRKLQKKTCLPYC